MRKFYIENETGARYALNGEQGIWLTKPQGLGVTFKGNYATLGNGFFKGIYRDTKQNSITGDITFLRDVYAQYSQFATWLMTAEKLFLVYQPQDTEYFSAVDVNFITKSEINRGRWLNTPISFNMLTPWYRPTPTQYNITPAPDNVMVYSWRYNQTVYGSLGGSMTALVPVAGHIPATWELSYSGELMNPVILITGQSTQTVYGRIAIEATVTGLEVSTKYLDSYIRGGGEDILTDVDITYDPYPRLPMSEPVFISLSATNELEGDMAVTINYYYRTV